MGTIQHNYTYASTLSDALKINWKVDDLIGEGKGLDFTKPFLPDSLTGIQAIAALDAREKLALNHIRGRTYLYLFGFVEEFILPFVLEQARRAVHGDSAQVRSLLTFAEEEAKHIDLFRRFSEEFEKQFPTPVGLIGPAKELADAVLSHSPLGVVLVILHLEWLTQRHYLESIKDDGILDPQFKSLLRHHWQEEAQHAKVDTLLASELAAALSADEIKVGIEDYLKIASLLNDGLTTQAKLDVETLERHTGRSFSAAERSEIEAAQISSYRHTFLVAGAEHPNFVKAVGELSAEGRERIAAVARALN
ncbi:diiron oxygenase [Pendulispora albinea]|uniref:Diiron oxygenase n=1 Tax=Pendulispora albinea TaxID=2741071 RepID=A0ABZ2LJN6_9BACT